VLAAPGEWELHPGTPKSASCSGTFQSPDGLQVIYSVSTGYVWSIEFSKAEWRFYPGGSFNASLMIGNRQITRHAIATSEHQVRLALQDSLPIFLELSRAWQLELVVGAFRSKVGLGFGDKVLRDLTRCVTRLQSRTTAKEQGELTRALNALPNPQSAEVAALGAKVLADVGAKNPKQLANPAIFSFRNGAGWQIGDLSFGITAVPALPSLNGSMLLPTLISRDVRLCRGESFAAMESQAKDSVAGYASCQVPGVWTSAFYLALPRPAGGFYLAETIISAPEMPEPVERAANDLNGALRSALLFATRAQPQAAQSGSASER
jgi:hypothetical protein